MKAESMPPQVIFDEAKHIYTLDGMVLPSVTQVLKPLYDFSGIPKDVLARKAELGTAVHKACELLDADQLDWGSVNEDMSGYVLAYLKFLDEVKPEILSNEERFASAKLRFAGTMDKRALVRGKHCIIDVKCTASLSPIVGLQTAAYEGLVKENTGEKVQGRYALQLKPDETYVFQPYTGKTDWAVFCNLLSVHHWKVANGI